MCGKLKKFFSFLVLLFFSFLGLFIPLKPALAVWDWLVGAITVIPALQIAFILVLFGTIAALLAAFSGVVLNWVISGDSFTKLSYTNPANNDIIKVGLGITQGFVNMLLVLVLVYIAIATILRLAGYETKKLLVWFIIIALLVNFSPVICGLIVDASNIIMNFFLSEITGGKNLISQLGSIWGTLADRINWKIFKATEQADIVVQLALVTVLNLVLFFVLMLFAWVFIARYIVIWILVILSPLAFVCYILPITRKFWSLWWQQFFAWSFIGVTCGFFLYLADLLTTTDLKQTPPTGQIGSAILPHLVPLGFLIIGLVFGLKTSAMGASTVMSLGKRGQKWVGGKIWRKGIRPRVEPTLKKVTGALVRKAEKVPVGRWFIPEAARRYAEFRPTIDYEKAQLKDFNSRAIGHRIAVGELRGTMATGGIMELLDRGDMQDLIGAYKTKYYGKDADKKSDAELFARKDFQNKVGEPIELAFRSGYQSKLLRGDPRLARIAAGQKWAFGYEDLDKEGAVKKATKEARAKNIENWEREVLMDKDVAETLLSRGRDAPEAIDRLVKRGQETLLKTFDNNFSEWVDKEPKDKELIELIKKFPNIINSVKKGDQPATESVLKIYQEYIKSEYGTNSYFKYVEGPRAKEIGWRKPEYVTENKRKEQPPAAKAGLQAGLGKPSKIILPAETEIREAKEQKEKEFREKKEKEQLPKGRSSPGGTMKGRSQP